MRTHPLAAPLIEHDSYHAVKFWKNQRRGESRICLWLVEQDYIVVLAERNGYLLPWTAYVVDQPHRKQKLRREYERYWAELHQNG